MSSTPRLSLPLIAAGQAQKHVTHNDALTRLDGMIHLSVVSRSQTAPPSSPTETSAYLVPAGGSGVFAGRTDQLALYEDAGWTFLAPRKGWQCWIEDEAELHVWTGAEWRRASPLSSLGASLWGVNGTADTTTRFVVQGQASLFNHAGGGHQLKLNKAAAGQTASLLYQTGYSGRAEIGLAGDDDFRFKVSPDGAAWHEALVIERGSGRVSLPATPWARETAQPNLLINGDFQINQRFFGGGALASGAYGFDRWKADAGGTSISRSGFTVTLASGALAQFVEPAQWGLASFAGLQLCLSVEDLSGSALSVSAGSAAGMLTPGSGRRALALTPAAGDTGALKIRLAADAGTASFARVKLEVGPVATGRFARPQTLELLLCRHYFLRRDVSLTIEGYQAAGYAIRQEFALPVRMRTTPTVGFSALDEVNVQGSDRGLNATSPEAVSAHVTAAATGRVRAVFGNLVLDAEL